MLGSCSAAPRAAVPRSRGGHCSTRATSQRGGASAGSWGQHGGRQPASRVQASMTSESRADSGREAGVINSAPAGPALPSMPPPPPRVQHSSAFLLREVRSSVSSAAAEATTAPSTPSPEDVGVVEWALRRADEELAQIEKSPTPVARAAWLLGRAAGQVASDPAVQTAAKVTVKVTTQVAKAVVPLGMSLGKWAIQAALPALLAAGEQERGGTVRKKGAPKRSK